MLKFDILDENAHQVMVVKFYDKILNLLGKDGYKLVVPDAPTQTTLCGVPLYLYLLRQKHHSQNFGDLMTLLTKNFNPQLRVVTSIKVSRAFFKEKFIGQPWTSILKCVNIKTCVTRANFSTGMVHSDKTIRLLNRAR